MIARTDVLHTLNLAGGMRLPFVPMYTLEQLQQKNIKELKEIGLQLNVLPEGDKRCHQNWIDALVGVNLPLLQLLELSPAASVVEQVQPIIETVETPSAVEVEFVQEPLAESSPGATDCPFCGAIHALFTTKDCLDKPVIRCLHCAYSRPKNYPGAIQSLAQESFGSKFGRAFYPWPAQKPIAQAVENSPGVEVDPISEPIAPAVEKFSGVERVTEFNRNNFSGFECVQELIENSSGVDVDRAQEPIALAAKNSPGVKVEQVQEPIVPTTKTFAEKVSSSKKVKANSYLDCPSCGIGRLRVKQSIYWETSCTKCGYFAESTLYPFTPADTGYKVGDWVKLRIKPRLATNIRRGEVVCIDKVCDDYLRFVNPNLNPALVLWARRQFLHPHEVSPCESPVVKAAETSPGVKTEVTVSESAIVPAVKTSFDAESDRNPILTGIPLSDKFLARYSPPQPENIRFQSEADGQLSLLNFEVVTESEPPDPDDFETLDAFREAIARWDTENSELLAASIDSMCEWAPCPEEWYWPKAEILPLKPSSTSDQLLPLQQSSVIELSIADESSITCNFFIPTFDAWCDRFNRSDEPPDTGIYATLPKPKPPSFPPTAASQARVKRILNASQTHPKYIPKVSRTHTYCIVAGSSTQPARSPPGGDAGF